jgi:large subunit ribosomal protein L25
MVTLVDEKGIRTTAIIKEVQWNRLTDKPLHVDFYRVSMDQIVEVKVPIHFEGSPKGLLFGGVFDQLMHDLPIKVKASSIPSRITIDVSGLDIGDSLHVSDLVLPEGVRIDTQSDLPIAHVVPPIVEKAKPAAEAAAEEAAPAPAAEEEKKK